MTRLRKIRKWGNTHVVVLTKPDRKDMDLSEGDLVDIEDIIKVNKKRKDNEAEIQ